VAHQHPAWVLAHNESRGKGEPRIQLATKSTPCPASPSSDHRSIRSNSRDSSCSHNNCDC
jgi:hypothetical protein